MPTIIDCEQWDFDPDRLDTGFQPNSGDSMTTQAILDSMAELEQRPEMKELVKLIRQSGQYAKGKNNA